MSTAVKFKVPFQTSLGNGVKSHVMYQEVTGSVHGPFLVHRAIRGAVGGKWGLTHSATGYSCVLTPSKEAAVSAAKLLMGIADWSFDDPSAVKDWDEETMKKVTSILMLARAGAVQ